MFIGCDIEDISRFLGKSKEFLDKIYTKSELDYCMKFSNPSSHLAVRFCAKEAVIKAFSSIYKISSYKKIEILNASDGAPYVNILIDELKEYKISISLSHEKQKAMAAAIVYK